MTDDDFYLAPDPRMHRNGYAGQISDHAYRYWSTVTDPYKPIIIDAETARRNVMKYEAIKAKKR